MTTFLFFFTLLHSLVRTPSAAFFLSFENEKKEAFAKNAPSFFAADTAFAPKWQQLIAHEQPEKVYLQLDKTIYEQGEALWFSAFVRQTDLLAAKSEIVYVELIAPNGNVLKKLQLIAQNGTAAGDFQLTESMVGGLYTLRAYTTWQQNSGDFFEKTVQIQQTVVPKLNMQLDFQRKGYGAGDEVRADFSATTLENEPLKQQNLVFTVSFEGQQTQTHTATTNAEGKAMLSFRLPNDINTTDVLLNVWTEHNSSTESIARPVPIVLKNIDLQFLPEGGTLAENIPTRLAFKALDAFGKPADVTGEILNQKGKKVADFKTYHNGMGYLDWTPKAGETYTARLTAPHKDKTHYPIPNVEKNTVVLNFLEQTETALRLSLAATESRTLTLCLTAQDKLFFTKKINATTEKTTLTLPTADLPIGIATVTVFDENAAPIAERLVFLNAHKRLNINILTDKNEYAFRETVRIKLKVTDENKRPVRGTFAVSAIDEALLSLADDRQANILAYFLLESDLKGTIEEPNFYFETPTDNDRINRKIALDLVMMTHGWRRYFWTDALAQNRSPKPKPHETTRVEGVVLDAMRRRLPNAQVQVEGQSWTTSTDSNGVFVFEKLPFAPPFMLLLSHGRHKERLLVQQFGNQPTVNLDANFVADLSGQTVDYFNRPLAGVTVKIKSTTDTRSVLTDENGKFHFSNIDFWEYQKMVISSKDDRKVMQTNIFAGVPQVFKLNTIETVKGKVINEFGEPLMNVEVFCGSEQTRTNKDGAFVFRGIPTESSSSIVAIYNNKRAYASLQQGLITLVIAEAKPKIVYRDNGSSNADLEVVVRDNSGEAVIGASVHITKQDFKGGIVTDFDGFAKTTLEPDTYALRIDYVGYESVIIEEVVLKQGQTVQVSAVLENNSVMLEEVVVAYRVPLIESDNSVQMSSREIKTLNKKGKPKPQPQPKPVSVAKDEVLNQKNNFSEKEKTETNTESDKTKTENNPIRNPFKGLEKVQVSYDEATREAIAREQAYAINYATGYYKARTFYTPKYDNKKAKVRNDFATTRYWNAALRTDENGEATAEFPNGDNETTFRITAAGFGDAGQIGLQTTKYAVTMPFAMTTKLPSSILTGDRLLVPITLSNRTDKAISGSFRLKTPPHFSLVTRVAECVVIYPNSVEIVFLEFLILQNKISDDNFLVQFETADFTETFTATLPTQQRGFPVTQVLGGNALRQDFDFNLADFLEGSLSVNLNVHLSTATELISGVERMLRQPSGCFEQVTSSNYPNLLALQLLQQQDTKNPTAQKQAADFLNIGYKKLLAYEVAGGGFDWWGNAPAHEGLTAYGLMQFVDMSAVYPVEKALIDRTATWLLSRRNGKGGWLLNERHLHDWVKNDDIRNAYIAWAMVKAGYQKEIAAEIEAVVTAAHSSEDAYVIALAANILATLNDARYQSLVEKLKQKQEADGSLMGLTTSITFSQNQNLRVETTALFALALLESNAPDFTALGNALKYLASAKTEYGFGSTQSTVLAMKALALNAQKNSAPKTDGTVTLFLSNQKIRTQPFTAGSTEPLVFNDLDSYFKIGDNRLTLQIEGTEKPLPSELTIKYNTASPNSDPRTKIAISTTLAQTTARISETVRLQVTLQKQDTARLQQPIAVVGIPSGLSIPPYLLRQLQEQNAADYIELWNGYIVFYFRHLDADRLINLDLKAETAGTFEAPASSAYLYYDNTAKSWAKPVALVVQ